jgi:thymidine phosphorylase
VRAGETLAQVHYNLDTRLEDAVSLLDRSFEIASAAPPPIPLIQKIIDDRD